MLLHKAQIYLIFSTATNSWKVNCDFKWLFDQTRNMQRDGRVHLVRKMILKLKKRSMCFLLWYKNNVYFGHSHFSLSYLNAAPTHFTRSLWDSCLPGSLCNFFSPCLETFIWSWYFCLLGLLKGKAITRMKNFDSIFILEKLEINWTCPENNAQW